MGCGVSSQTLGLRTLRLVAAVCLWCEPQLVLQAADSPSAGLEQFYVGTYTTYSGSKSKGIYWSSLDLGTGTLGVTNLAVTATDPSFLAMHPNHRFLYAVNESGGYVVAYSVDPGTGKLTQLNQLSSNEGAPCHVTCDSAGGSVLVANYSGGSVTVLSILANGSLGAQTAHIQHTGTGPSGSGPLVHCVVLDASNHFALVCDKGLDRVFSYHFDPDHGTLTTNNPPWAAAATGSGPRHLAFEPQYGRAYVICELNSTIIGFNYDAQGGLLSAFQTISTLPSGWSGQNTGAEIAVHPSGSFVYGSNRGHNSIVVYSVNPANGLLTLVQHQPTGLTPRNFAIDPTGAYCLVANQDSNTILLYSINLLTGALTPKSQSLLVAKPVCVLPFFVQPPQPVLRVSSAATGMLQVGIDNGYRMLAYELLSAPELSADMSWSLMMTGVRGQTNFSLSNTLPQSFLRARVVTNW